MTKRDFFLLTLKLAALYMLYKLLINVADFILTGGMTMLLYFDEVETLFTYASLAIFISLTIFSISLLLKNSEWIIKRLGLDKGFDQEELILTESSEQKLGRLGFILIGFFLVTQNLIEAIRLLAIIFKNKVTTQKQLYISQSSQLDWQDFVLPFFQLLFGIVLINLAGRISSKLFDKGDLTSENEKLE